MIPRFRRTLYGNWRACERFGILPPEIRPTWDEMNAWQRSQLIAYDQVRQYEEAEEFSTLMKTIAGVPRL